MSTVNTKQNLRTTKLSTTLRLKLEGRDKRDEIRDDNKPNIVINPADYPRYVTSALIYSQAIEKTKHVIYKNKYLAHRNQSRYPDHVDVVEKKGSQRRPWYHVHQCLDEKCPVHPDNVRLANVKEVSAKQDGKPSFLCSYLKDKLDISLFPYYRSSIKSFNASFITSEQAKKRSRPNFLLSSFWHDPHCEGCENKELHFCPIEDKLDLGEEIDEADATDTDISDILYRYRFLFNPDYIFGSVDIKGTSATTKHEPNGRNAHLLSSSFNANEINQLTEKKERNESLAETVNEISTCVGQVPRTPARQYSRHNTPRNLTPNRGQFFNCNQRSHHSNSFSQYCTPGQSAPNQSPIDRNITPYSPTCVPYQNSSPYSTPPRHVYTPPFYRTNQLPQYHPLSHRVLYDTIGQSAGVASHYGYLLPGGVSQGSYSYAPEMFANYYGLSYSHLHSSYNNPWSNAAQQYGDDYNQTENHIDAVDYDTEDPLTKRESRYIADRRDKTEHDIGRSIQRRSSHGSNHKKTDDKRSYSRNSPRYTDHKRRSSYRRDRKTDDLDRKRHGRSIPSNRHKRSKQTHSYYDNHRYIRRSSRKSTSNHSMSSESTINYSKLSPRQSRESRRSSNMPKSKDGDRRRSSSRKSRDDHKHKSCKQLKSNEEPTIRKKSKSRRQCGHSSKKSSSQNDGKRSLNR